MKLAIVGGGPSSFFVASRLLSLLPETKRARIDIYDRLWAPHGLVRYGVAPDHPEVKNCTHKFDVAGADPRVRFFGNVNVGSTPSSFPGPLALSMEALQNSYTHLLFATGCTVPLVHAAIPPSEHCRSALAMVHWYTQHPSAPPPPALDKIEHVAIVGQGNVALDVARMLLAPISHLEKYDVPMPVLDVLSRSTVKHVSILGRRGPYQAAFTTKEIRELLNLPNASMAPIPVDVLAPPEGTPLTRQQGRIVDLLRKGSQQPFGSTPRTWSLDFFRSPTGLTSLGPHAARLHFAHTLLEPETARGVPTGETSALDAGLVVPALGHRAEPGAPWIEPALGHIRTSGPGGGGRVLNAGGALVRRVYASGWASMGARGVLAATMRDAHEVAAAILTDDGDGVSTVEQGRDVEAVMAEDVMDDEPPVEVQKGVKEGVITTYQDWKKVDEEEVRRGRERGKERERMGWGEARAYLAGLR